MEKEKLEIKEVDVKVCCQTSILFEEKKDTGNGRRMLHDVVREAKAHPCEHISL